MSAVAISVHGHAHTLMPSAAFKAHRHEDKGGSDAASSASIGKPGQLPVGSGKALLAGAVQSLLGGRLNVTA
jgi:hypothetical protein